MWGSNSVRTPPPPPPLTTINEKNYSKLLKAFIFGNKNKNKICMIKMPG